MVRIVEENALLWANVVVGEVRSDVKRRRRRSGM
jgi:hypothetical protein